MPLKMLKHVLDLDGRRVQVLYQHIKKTSAIKDKHLKRKAECLALASDAARKAIHPTSAKLTSNSWSAISATRKAIMQIHVEWVDEEHCQNPGAKPTQ